MSKENGWDIINSMWMEILCFAASNCPVDYHAEQLRQVGGLITHVWLLLAHKTDKFYTRDYSNCLLYKYFRNHNLHSPKRKKKKIYIYIYIYIYPMGKISFLLVPSPKPIEQVLLLMHFI